MKKMRRLWKTIFPVIACMLLIDSAYASLEVNDASCENPLTSGMIDLDTDIVFLPNLEDTRKQAKSLASAQVQNQKEFKDGKLRMVAHLSALRKVANLPTNFCMQIGETCEQLLVWDSKVQRYAPIFMVDNLVDDGQTSVYLDMLIPPETSEKIRADVTGNPTPFKIRASVACPLEENIENAPLSPMLVGVEIAEVPVVAIPERNLRLKIAIDNEEGMSISQDFSKSFSHTDVSVKFGVEGLVGVVNDEKTGGRELKISATGGVDVGIFQKEFRMFEAELASTKQSGEEFKTTISLSSLGSKFYEKELKKKDAKPATRRAMRNTAAEEEEDDEFEYDDGSEEEDVDSGRFTIELSMSWAKTRGYSTIFSLGPVPVKVEAGAKGEIGIKGTIVPDISLLEWKFSIEEMGPFVDLGGYARAGVTALVVTAGVQASLSLLTKQLAVATELTLGGSNGYAAAGDISIGLEGPQGSISAFVEWTTPKFCTERACTPRVCVPKICIGAWRFKTCTPGFCTPKICTNIPYPCGLEDHRESKSIVAWSSPLKLNQVLKDWKLNYDPATRPDGSYQDSCERITPDGTDFTATCEGTELSFANFADCTTDIAYRDGALACTSIPQGSYDDGCSNVSVYGERLSADCGNNAVFLDDFRHCDTDITYQAGQLKCTPLPAGSYTSTCDNISVYGTTVSARCQQGNTTVNTSLDDFAACGDIANNNGQLACATVPYGSYQDSCNNSSVYGTTLSTQCGSQALTLENFPSCTTDIAYNNGQLVCTPLPTGSYRDSCENVTVYATTLSARCDHNDSSLANYANCSTDIANTNGQLVCTPIPDGSYQDSCSNPSVYATTLSARCGSNNLSLTGFANCADIGYQNSQLVCTAIPTGSYQDSCSNTSVYATTLSATCGGNNLSFSNYPSCSGDLGYQGGKLVCLTPPDGSYLDSCSNATVYGTTLSAVCGGIKRSYSNYPSCATEIGYKNSQLVCTALPEGNYKTACSGFLVENGKNLRMLCENQHNLVMNNFGSCDTIGYASGALSCNLPIPDGSYKTHCEDISVTGSTLTANCPISVFIGYINTPWTGQVAQYEERMASKSLANFDQCYEGVRYVDETLKCDIPDGDYGGITGSDCKDIYVEGTTVYATCRVLTFTNFHDESLSLSNYHLCKNRKVYFDSPWLECYDIPDGPYQAQGCSNSVVGSTSLYSDCYNVNDGQVRETYLHNYLLCLKDNGQIVNENGQLTCSVP